MLPLEARTGGSLSPLPSRLSPLTSHLSLLSSSLAHYSPAFEPHGGKSRDAAAVAEWIKSGKGFHVIRDHPSHSLYPMSGGLWGAKRGALPQVMELIASFPTDSK